MVYAQGALCRRLARGSVPPDGRVRVPGLPRSLDPGSLRARVLGAPGVRVTEARVEVEAEPLGSGTPDALRREVERLADAHAMAQGRRNRQLSLIEEVRSLHPVPPPRKRDDPHRRTPVDAWLELADFVDERLAGLHARLVELEEELRAAEHEFSVAADRLARASTDAPSSHVETTLCAALTLVGAGEDEVELELEYGVPGAVWVPAYRLTHRQGDDSGHLVLRASVAQRTGEDWTGVRIALATADLRRRTDLPKLRSVRIGRRQPAPAPSGWREPPAGLAGLFAGYETAGPRPVATAGPATAGAGADRLAAAAHLTSGASATSVTSVTSVGGSAYGPVPPPPPPPPMPAPQGYGGAMPDFALAPPAQPVASRPGGRARSASRSFAGAPAAMPPAAMAPPAPAAPGGAP
ncbi:DUF4139 domain-containing protein, partial [Streptomyces sp. NPDC060020]|uniref:DUF4139 domain-containing protein n=1 Tax=Streptomyces sp. NPDC060020 TaxID=3347038 RepID=UPI0036C5412B